MRMLPIHRLCVLACCVYRKGETTPKLRIRKWVSHGPCPDCEAYVYVKKWAKSANCYRKNGKNCPKNKKICSKIKQHRRKSGTQPPTASRFRHHACPCTDVVEHEDTKASWKSSKEIILKKQKLFWQNSGILALHFVLLSPPLPGYLAWFQWQKRWASGWWK